MCELENSKTLVPTYCHGAFNQHNVVYTQSGIWLPVNFYTMHPGYPETDLAEYMRKMLEKNHWDTAVADAILDSYCSVRSLMYTSMRLLQALLLFPENFVSSAITIATRASHGYATVMWISLHSSYS